MTARVLDPEEWGRLAGTELEAWTHILKPSTAKVVVVEHEGEIVGRWMAIPMWHVEGLWIADAHRGKTGVARRLWAAMRRVMREVGADAAVTGAETDAIRALLDHAGATRVPFDTYVLPFEKES